MNKIIKFLTDCYQVMIVIAFIGSILMYIGFILLCLTSLVMSSDGPADIDAITFGTYFGSIVLVSIFEGIFLVALGGAAILVDIRIAITNKRKA